MPDIYLKLMEILFSVTSKEYKILTAELFTLPTDLRDFYRNIVNYIKLKAY